MKDLVQIKGQRPINWIEGSKAWGTIICPPTLKSQVFSLQEGDIIRETYRFINITNDEQQYTEKDISIYATLDDIYGNIYDGNVQRCHTHIWCGENVSYIMGIRMKKDAIHLGLVLTRGSLVSYSTKVSKNESNDVEKNIYLHPAPFSLKPGESLEIEWVLFLHKGKDDFYRKISRYTRYIDIRAEKFVYELTQEVEIDIFPIFPYRPSTVNITRGGEPVPITIYKDRIEIKELIEEPGAYEYKIEVDGVHTVCRIFVQIPLVQLLEKRCHYIVDNHQIKDKTSLLYGDYVLSGLEDTSISFENKKKNVGEYVGMGALLATYLQINSDDKIEESLKCYEDFLYREVINTETGVLYFFEQEDYPKVIQFLIELYDLYHEKKYIQDAYTIATYYCSHGGFNRSSVEVSIVDLCYSMEFLGMERETRKLNQYLYSHTRDVVRDVMDNPEFDMESEQGIIASSSNHLLRLYLMGNDKRFLAVAEKYLRLLSFFCGQQPDYRLYGNATAGYYYEVDSDLSCVSILPHYCNILTSKAYVDYAVALGEKDAIKKMDECVAGALRLFRPNGSIFCGKAFALENNRERCATPQHCNKDQDWALYYATNSKMRYLKKQE